MSNISLVSSIQVATLVVHPDPFHGDEVMATAIQAALDGHVTVYRTRDEAVIAEAKQRGVITICDVGGEYDPDALLFDHHQAEFSERRPDGTKYAAAGLLWKEYGVDVCASLTGCTFTQAKAAAQQVDQMLIKGIDLVDSGVSAANGLMSVGEALFLFNPGWDEAEQNPAVPANWPGNKAGLAFIQACELALQILERTVKYCVAAEKGKESVELAVQAASDHIMVLPQYIDGWIETVQASQEPKASELLYGVFKNVQGEWMVQALPPDDDPTAQRKPLPESWRGLRGEALRTKTGVEDAIFCHAARFICGAKSYAGAMQLAIMAINA